MRRRFGFPEQRFVAAVAFFAALVTLGWSRWPIALLLAYAAWRAAVRLTGVVFGEPGERVAIPESVKEAVVGRWGERCHYCGVPTHRLFLCAQKAHDGCDRCRQHDHMDPVAAGGENSAHNLTVACRWCNQTKGAMPYAAFVHKMSTGEIAPPHGAR